MEFISYTWLQPLSGLHRNLAEFTVDADAKKRLGVDDKASIYNLQGASYFKKLFCAELSPLFKRLPIEQSFD